MQKKEWLTQKGNFNLSNYSTFDEKNAPHQNYENSSAELSKGSLMKVTGDNVAFWEDRYNILLLFLIYSASGLAFGFFLGSLNVILTKGGASYSQLSLLSLIVYPFSLKFIWAPICDSYYFSNRWGLGKRKTYIVIGDYVVGVILFICAFYINSWIYEINAVVLTLVGFLIISCLAFESIGVDAWSVSILHPNNVTYAALALNAGQDLGYIVTYNVFIWLNLRGGKNKETQSHNQIISSQTLFFIIGSLFIFVGFITHCFKKEECNYDSNYEGLKKVFTEMKGFFKNKNLVFLIMVFLFVEFAFASVGNLSSIILIKKKFSTDLIDSFDFSSTFIGMLGYFISVYFSKQKKEWTLYLVCLFFRFLFDFMMYFIVISYDKETNNTKMIILYGVNTNLYAIVIDCYEMSRYSFILRISEGNSNVAATFITVLVCVNNFGSAWTNTFSLWLLDRISFNVFTFITWIYGLVFFAFFGTKIREMEDLNENEWKLSNSQL